MKKSFILLLLSISLIFSLDCYAEDSKENYKWDKWDKTLFASFVILEAIDCGQTRYIFEHPGKYHEVNPIINKLGKDGIIPYFVGCTIGAYFIADRLNSSHRKIFLSTLNLIEVGFTHHNKSIGIKIHF